MSFLIKCAPTCLRATLHMWMNTNRSSACLCTLYAHIVCALCLRTLSAHIVCAHCLRTLSVHLVWAHCMRTLSAHISCLYAHIVCAYCRRSAHIVIACSSSSFSFYFNTLCFVLYMLWTFYSFIEWKLIFAMCSNLVSFTKLVNLISLNIHNLIFMNIHNLIFMNILAQFVLDIITNQSFLSRILT